MNSEFPNEQEPPQGQEPHQSGQRWAGPQGRPAPHTPHGGHAPSYGAWQGQGYGSTGVLAAPPAYTGWGLRRKAAAAAAVVAIALGAGGVGAAAAIALNGDEPVVGSSAPVTGVRQGASIAQVAAAVQPSVVSITALSGAGTSGGSGVVIDANGTIMTNRHVIADADRVTVKFSDGRTAPAEVVGASDDIDIAVVKVSGVSGLKPASLGNSDALAVGDTVLAVGSPLGLDGSVTAGIVSALGRHVQEDDGPQQVPPFLRQRLTERESSVIANAIQTDAAINPGNSGGALVNGAGQVVGINTAIATSGNDSGNIGVGFAIPINDARKAAQSIIQGG
ncbi:hypothetical protein Acsp03_48340 [Actinomadura sp. NBRC 104412]|uniref:S1C family serine protease n=1 Tax=Actinomadura sp. NBRC 104412 TaxID=3032203 RepID=UPI0024A39A76|nr:trypsin-like peptidase domain-containing protein [Actinomadura sp. NBRC 104412]GLZ07368.1 hypothetical protein Acsp03_48340 [Actinomadura sp. NBRC 104412]